MKLRILILVLSLACLEVLAGHGSRRVSPIATPQTIAPKIAGAYAVSAADFIPIAPEKIEPHLTAILSRWNTPEMQRDLAEGFRDKERLIESLNSKLPRDAKIRMLSLRGVQTVQQYEIPPGRRSNGKRVSIVSATASTQVEYQGANGLVRLPGINEFLLEVTEKL